MFGFIERERANHEVSRMCRLLKVSSSGYYAWRRRPLCPRKTEDARLLGLIIAIHRRSRDSYGMPRILDELRYDHGVRCSGKRVRRLMHQLGIKGAHRRRYRKTTERSPDRAPAPDLMNRNFTATRPDEKYVGDITYIRTWEGRLYLAIILDVFSRRIVGWAMGTTLHTELVVKAFEMAVRRRQARGAIAHSDQGCQTGLKGSSQRWVEPSLGARRRLRQEFSTREPCGAESFFATLECELLDQQSFRTRDQARTAVFDFIEAWYTPIAAIPRSASPGMGCNRRPGSNVDGSWRRKLNLLRNEYDSSRAVVCVICGRSIQRSGQGRRRLYCSNACRQRAFRQRDEERMWRGSDPDPEDVADVANILTAAIKPRHRR